MDKYQRKYNKGSLTYINVHSATVRRRKVLVNVYFNVNDISHGGTYGEGSIFS